MTAEKVETKPSVATILCQVGRILQEEGLIMDGGRLIDGTLPPKVIDENGLNTSGLAPLMGSEDLETLKQMYLEFQGGKESSPTKTQNRLHNGRVPTRAIQKLESATRSGKKTEVMASDSHQPKETVSSGPVRHWSRCRNKSKLPRGPGSSRFRKALRT